LKLIDKTLMSGKQIGTHSGSFHCDEALACHLLHLTDEYKGAEIVRSRDPKVLEPLSILVDVGATYEPEKNRFDHHQKGFSETFSEEFTTKLSSAGLVYKHFGLQIIKNLHPGLSDQAAHTIYVKVYRAFVEALDGIDNGIAQYEGNPKYAMSTDLSSRVGRLNPSWNEKVDSAEIDRRFAKAVALAGGEFEDTVAHYVQSWLPARAIVQSALEERRTHDASGEIVVLKDYTSWAGHLFDLESEMGIAGEAKYVLYKDSAGAWRIQAVAVAPGSFTSRYALPEEWRGLRDEVVSKKAGIEGCIFVHAGGFIGGNKTFEGVLKMATVALSMRGEPDAKRQKTSK
jgi:uncharacterized UPF0160 family protein